MKQVTKIRLITAFALSVILPLALKPIFAADQTVNLRLSAGNSWQARNDVQIPNTDLGTRFSLEEAVGAELRVLDGGADTDSVYNFARFNSAAIVVSTVF